MNEVQDSINQAIDRTELLTLEFVLKLLSKYPVKVVKAGLEAKIMELKHEQR